MQKIRFAVSAIAILAVSVLIASCGAKPLPPDQSAKVASKVAFGTNGGIDTSSAVAPSIIADIKSKVLSRAIIENSQSVSGSITNPQGGSATYSGTVTLSIDTTTYEFTGSMVTAVTYTDWFIEEDGEEYTVSGTLTLSCPLDFDFDVDLEAGSVAYTISYTVKGDLEITNGASVTEASVDLKSDFSFSSSVTPSTDSAAVTVTCHTTGTVNEVAVDQNFTFSSTVDLGDE